MPSEHVPRYVLREVRGGARPRAYELDGCHALGSMDGVELVLAEDFDRLLEFMRETLATLEDMLLAPPRRPS